VLQFAVKSIMKQACHTASRTNAKRIKTVKHCDDVWRCLYIAVKTASEMKSIRQLIAYIKSTSMMKANGMHVGELPLPDTMEEL